MRALDWTEESVWAYTILARLDQQQDEPRRAYDRLITAAKSRPSGCPSCSALLQSVKVLNVVMTLAFDHKLLTQRDPQLRIIWLMSTVGEGMMPRLWMSSNKA